MGSLRGDSSPTMSTRLTWQEAFGSQVVIGLADRRSVEGSGGAQPLIAYERSSTCSSSTSVVTGPEGPGSVR